MEQWGEVEKEDSYGPQEPSKTSLRQGLMGTMQDFEWRSDSATRKKTDYRTEWGQETSCSLQ
jgi:hypothetical protein